MYVVAPGLHWGMWLSSSPPRDQTGVPAHGKPRVLTTAPPGKFPILLFQGGFSIWRGSGQKSAQLLLVMTRGTGWDHKGNRKLTVCLLGLLCKFLKSFPSVLPTPQGGPES